MLQIRVLKILSNPLKLLFIYLISIFLNSCTKKPTGVRLGEWNQAGIQNEYVNTLKTNNDFLYAASRTDLFQLPLETTDAWEALGLKGHIDDREIRDFIVFSETEILAGVRTIDEFEEGTIPLWKTSTGGGDWQPYQNGFGDEAGNYNAFSNIDATPTMDTLFARASAAIARSVDRGKSWELVYGSWDRVSLPKFIYVDETKPRNIWTGGGTVIFSPSLLKTTDNGSSWSFLEPIKNVEADVHDLVLIPNRPQTMLIGMSGGVAPANIIRLSTDSGKTWETVFEGISTRTMETSIVNSEIIYASGRNTSSSLFFLQSDNFGDTWQTVEFTDGPTGIQVNDMVSVMVDGREVLYFGTNKGVYSYEFEE